MKYLLLTLFVIFNVCYGDDIDVNNVTEIIPPVTEVPPGPSNHSSIAPHPPTPSPTTIPTTTLKPNVTTLAPNVTTLAPNVTTLAPTTTTIVPTTTNGTTTVSPKTTTTVVPPTNGTTTTVPTPSTTQPSNKTTTPAPSPKPNNRKFDGPSFVGGIVLASGLVAIGFVAFKFYKARTELNYHTL